MLTVQGSEHGDTVDGSGSDTSDTSVSEDSESGDCTSTDDLYVQDIPCSPAVRALLNERRTSAPLAKHGGSTAHHVLDGSFDASNAAGEHKLRQPPAPESPPFEST